MNQHEVFETLKMIREEKLDIRTITMGISLLDCADGDIKKSCRKIREKIVRLASRLAAVGDEIEESYGVPIINKRVAVTPIALVAESSGAADYGPYARALEDAAAEVNVNFIGGFSALVHKGMTPGDRALIASIPRALASTERVCASVNVATSRSGINMDAIIMLGRVIKEISLATKDRGSVGCARLVVFANAPEDNPFMAGAFHGPGEAEAVINVGISGPGVIKSALEKIKGSDLEAVSETIKRTSFKITRVGQLVAREAARRLDVPFGIVDVSLAPTPSVGDSVAAILEEIGLERCGAPGSTAALMLLNDAVKKGGLMASSFVGGLSGAFIPVSEDQGMIDAVEAGALTIEKLEAMTSVCSVGLDMIAIPGDTGEDTIAAIIADEAAIGVANNKTTAVRIIPVAGMKAGDLVEFGGLLGRAPVMPVNGFSPGGLIRRGGRIPAPLQSYRN
ncbi:MAG TPA: PFL family protein [Spirochaetota bacterium]|nr:PFL family protein [Spirochaetota bacterium]HOD16360.1 PFL family protein [Spirochaetota bacterium]HPG52473.1 PFL family protein [Spirochaetota bacterium]HPN10855.1 PFL family protein [Spirochaetota bacterium]HQL82269.1 PFL family protein [Spirochaetota bacterium]